MGVPKQRESVWGIFKELIKGIGMTNQCGSVRLDFGAPVRLTVAEIHYDFLINYCIALTFKNY